MCLAATAKTIVLAGFQSRMVSFDSRQLRNHMWIALIAVVVILIAFWCWSVWRDKFMCPVCGHSMSAHRRGISGRLSRGRSYCLICGKECV